MSAGPISPGPWDSAPSVSFIVPRDTCSRIRSPSRNFSAGYRRLHRHLTGYAAAGYAEEFAWALERFVSEAKALRKLAEPQPHPNIIQVQHVKKNGTSYFVMK